MTLLGITFKLALAVIAVMDILLEAFTPQPLVTGWMKGIHVLSLLYLLYLSIQKNFVIEEGHGSNKSYRRIQPPWKRKEKVADIDKQKRKKTLL